MASTAATPKNLTFAEARERVLSAVRALPPEILPLAEARGRVLRRGVRASHPLPPFSNSAMDGYAVIAADLERAAPDHPVELPVVEVLPAGRVASRALERGEAMRIMTGSALPAGADAVVPFEDADRFGSEASERVRFTRSVPSGAFVRGVGEDLAHGEEVLSAGREISPHDLALLAALGVARVEVGRRPKVAVLSTGDELLRVEEPLRPGAIRDSNRLLLSALLEEAGCLVIRTETVRDDPTEVGTRLQRLLEIGDVVLSIGGVSAGDFDPVKQGLASLEGAELWRVAMKPGRPQAFGVLQSRMFYGLPGNPASVACVFEALVRPALRRMLGFSNLERPRLAVRAAKAIESRAGRTDFVRATLEWRDEGWWASPAGTQISGHLAPQARAHALVIVPEAAASLATGDPADAWLLRWPDPRSG